MEYAEKIHQYVAQHREEIVDTLKKLVRIPSIQGPAEPDAPFGRECARVLAYIETLYAQNGFATSLDKEGGYLLSCYGSGEKTLGLFAHADVVPVSDDWVHTTPFAPVEKDGYLIGRGVLDDKSAVVISLYCTKMLKELAIPFHTKLVMFTGSNEETGMKDADNYLRAHTAPDFSLIADTAFPLYRGDKSGMDLWVTMHTKLQDIQDFCGGKAMNVILGRASATVHGEAVTETGISRHAALPEGSVNAGYKLAKRLALREDICHSDREQMRFLADVLERYYGEIYGIEHSDECGKLTCTNGVIKTEGGEITFGLNMRFGLSADIAQVKKSIEPFFAQHNCTVQFGEVKKGYVTAEDHADLRACLQAYRAFMGEKDPPVYINAGGTYGRKLPCAAEIGTTTRGGAPAGTPQGHGGAHQSDECLSIEGFLQAIELTMQMLLACDRVEEG